MSINGSVLIIEYANFVVCKFNFEKPFLHLSIIHSNWKYNHELLIKQALPLLFLFSRLILSPTFKNENSNNIFYILFIIKAKK